MSSPLGIRERIEIICHGFELETSGILLTVDLRVIDISEFDVIDEPKSHLFLGHFSVLFLAIFE